MTGGTRAKARSRAAAPPALADVVYARIHPAIGIARVGDSEEGVFVGPQVCEPRPPRDGYRDESGALKRQMAEFRIYGYGADGQVICELTSANAEIDWCVHLANRKAAWYQWKQALDIPEAASDAVRRRNESIVGPAAREALVIDAGRQCISGRGLHGADGAVPARGHFFKTPVLLGELRIGTKGRLHVVPGHGRAGSPRRLPILDPHAPLGFANADGWYDDIADGPVEACVKVGGREVKCEAAWVVTAPPNYAPQLKSLTTLYDVLCDTYIQVDWMQPPQQVSFSKDVLPMLRRLTDLQWVNQGFAAQFGHLGVHDFSDPVLLARLCRGAGVPASPTDADAVLRRQIFDSFRVPGAATAQRKRWPWIYGDADSQDSKRLGPRSFASLTRSQYAVLHRWAQGDFVADWPPPAAVAPAGIDKLDVRLQPAMLDRAALEFCLGDVFHPGNEMTWPMRHVTLYSSPFRILQRSPWEPRRDPGPVLRASDLDGPYSPLRAQGPGDLTRWMAVPWQADTAMCGSGYDAAYDPWVPSYWPAHVPNHVLTQDAYDVIARRGTPSQARADAFAQRSDWMQPIAGEPKRSMQRMVKLFGSMGVLEAKPRPASATNLPETLLVAHYGPAVVPAAVRRAAPVKKAQGKLAAAAPKAAPPGGRAPGARRGGGR